MRRGIISQVARSIFFDPTGTSLLSRNVRAAILEVQAFASSFFAQEAFFVPQQTNTTSNGWVTASGYPVTSTLKAAGDYILDFSAEVGQSDKEKRVGTRIEYRFGTSGSWITFGDVRDSVSVDNQFQFRTGFRVITLPSTSVVQLRWRFGQTDDGGTGRIRNSAFKLTRRA